MEVEVHGQLRPDVQFVWFSGIGDDRAGGCPCDYCNDNNYYHYYDNDNDND